MRFTRVVRSFVCTTVLTIFAIPAIAQDKPNILVIWGDDIGYFNVGAYNHGAMGYDTPNIDSIAADGILFTDGYGQNSCTAGRSAFITGQSPFRTGLLKVGLPGAEEGLSEKAYVDSLIYSRRPEREGFLLSLGLHTQRWHGAPPDY